MTHSSVGPSGIGALIGLLFGLGIVLGIYLFYCFCLKRICEKAGKEPGALIWFPIVQIVPLLELTRLPVWTIVLFLIPVVNIVMGIILAIKLCEVRGKSPAFVVLLIIPLANLAFLPYLAFSE